MKMQLKCFFEMVMYDKIIYYHLYLALNYYSKNSFSSKYPCHKVPDSKHTGRQRDLKAVKIQ